MIRRLHFFALIATTSLMASTLPVAIAQDGNTGSVNASAEALPQGTGTFRQALDLLESESWVEAYDLARGLTDDAERRAVQWAAIYYGDGTIDYDSVLRFQADAPDYSTPGLYKTRMEQALTESVAGPDEIIRLLGGQMPNTLDAQFALAAAYVSDGQMERAGGIIKYIWTTNFLDRDLESDVLMRFGGLLTNEDHWARAVHLLMHDRASGTERIMDYLTPAQQSLAKARIAQAREQGNAQSLIDAVDPSYRDHPLFHFTRGQLAHDNGRLTSAVELYAMASGDLPDAAEWWYERRTLTRRLIRAGNYQTAYRAAADYTAGPEGRLVEANFHAGWIAISFLDDPALARQHFETMVSLSTLPGSVTQSNYWLGRAALELGDTEAARAAFETAAAFGTLYYGQLARFALGVHDVGLRPLPGWRESQAAFDNRELVRAIRLMAANGHEKLAEPLINRLASGLRDPGELLLAARLAQEIDAHHLAISVADTADRRGVALDLFAFPKDGLPDNSALAAIDHAAIYAIARQESRFDVDAISWAGARGLMQLMPGTAQDMARRVGVEYSANRLTSDAAYNAQLGSAYLEGQLDRYDGSLVLAAAAYNGGAGNVNRWLEWFGDPRSTNVDPVVWIELIPFEETRKYVRRVLGNYMVYRARLGDQSLTIEQALRAIPH